MTPNQPTATVREQLEKLLWIDDAKKAYGDVSLHANVRPAPPNGGLGYTFDIEGAADQILALLASETKRVAIEEVNKFRAAMTFEHATPSIYADNRIATLNKLDNGSK